jgi:hypothetical protein
MIYCTHNSCRLDVIQELLAIGKALPSRKKEFIARSAQALKAEVRCRKVPGRGRLGNSPQAPFPGEE